MTQSTPTAERVLVGIFVAGVVLSVGTFFAIMIATMMGVGEGDGFSKDPWPMVFMLPYVLLPVAMLALITLFVVNGRKKAGDAEVDEG